MKKLYAIVISLLFMASIFGVAQTMAKEYSLCEDCELTSITVQVGDTLVIQGFSQHPICTPECNCICISGDCGPGVEVPTYDCGVLIWENHSDPQRSYDIFRAARPGTAIIVAACMENNNVSPFCDRQVTVTVIPKKSSSLPMDWILKKFGLGKYK